MRVSGPFERIHMDLAGPFVETSCGHKYFVVAICPLTKYVIAKPLVKAQADPISRFLLENVILVHAGNCDR